MPRPAPFLPPSEPSPERRALAAAIAERETLKRDIAEASAAVTAADAALDVARTALNLADDIETHSLPFAEAQAKMSEQHRKGYSRGLAEAPDLNNLPRIHIAEARENLQAARDDYSSASRTLEVAKARADKLHDRLRWNRFPVESAVKRAALADPAYAALRREAVRLERAVIDVRQALFDIGGGQSSISDDEKRAVAMALPEAEREPVTFAWRTALQRLAEDADAVLPAVA